MDDLAISHPPPPPVKYRDVGTAYMLWAAGLLGFCRLWLFTAGVCGSGQLIDVLSIPGQVAAANARLALAAPAGAATPQLPPAKKITAKDKMRIDLCQAAKTNDGILTVTDAVLATGTTHEQAEKALDEMAKRRWVEIDNHPDSGVVIYRFTDFA